MVPAGIHLGLAARLLHSRVGAGQLNLEWGAQSGSGAQQSNTRALIRPVITGHRTRNQHLPPNPKRHRPDTKPHPHPPAEESIKWLSKHLKGCLLVFPALMHWCGTLLPPPFANLPTLQH